jgi:anti-sigma-K factor RskA
MKSVTEHIKPETLALIRSQARRTGISVDEYVRGLLPGDEKELALRPTDADDDFETDMAAFAENKKDFSKYNGTYSRKDIYADHD